MEKSAGSGTESPVLDGMTSLTEDSFLLEQERAERLSASRSHPALAPEVDLPPEHNTCYWVKFTLKFLAVFFLAAIGMFTFEKVETLSRFTTFVLSKPQIPLGAVKHLTMVPSNRNYCLCVTYRPRNAKTEETARL